MSTPKPAVPPPTIQSPDPLHGIAPPEVIEEFATTRAAIQQVSDQQATIMKSMSPRGGLRRSAEVWQILAGIAVVIGLCLTMGTILVNYTASTRDAIQKTTTDTAKNASDISEVRHTQDQMLIDNRGRDTTSQASREDVSAIRADIRWLRDEWDHKGPANDRTSH